MKIYNEGEFAMKCPYCNAEMESGYIGQSELFVPITWVSDNVKEDAILPVHKTIKLTAMLKGGRIATHHCENCKKFIIDENDIER